MVKRRFDVEVPAGQHLGFSRDTDGAYRAHLFDDRTNRLVGHAELTEPDDDEPHDGGEYQYRWSPDEDEPVELTPEEIAEALEALVTIVLVTASLAVAAAPHVRRWWKRAAVAARSARARAQSAARSSTAQVANALRSPWSQATRGRKRTRAGVRAVATTDRTRRSATPSTELELAFQDYRARMSSAEARERFVAALLAKAFSEEQMRLLRSVRIEDDHGEVALGGLLDVPTPPQVRETVRLMLEKNPSLLDGPSLAGLSHTLGSGALGLPSAPGDRAAAQEAAPSQPIAREQQSDRDAR